MGARAANVLRERQEGATVACEMRRTAVLSAAAAKCATFAPAFVSAETLCKRSEHSSQLRWRDKPANRWMRVQQSNMVE